MKLVGQVLCVCLLLSGFVILGIDGVARGDELEPLSARRIAVHKRYFGRFLGPRSHYASATQTGVYDSCWRRRVIAGPWGPEVLSKWICRDYFTYGSYYDWGYGRAPADRLPGYPWWW
jgi:hypothetical protein